MAGEVQRNANRAAQHAEAFDGAPTAVCTSLQPAHHCHHDGIQWPGGRGRGEGGHLHLDLSSVAFQFDRPEAEPAQPEPGERLSDATTPWLLAER